MWREDLEPSDTILICTGAFEKKYDPLAFHFWFSCLSQDLLSATGMIGGAPGS
jgi:hypothetical protein